MESKLKLTISIDFKGREVVDELLGEIARKHKMDVEVDTGQLEASIKQVNGGIKSFAANFLNTFSKIGFAIQGVQQSFRTLNNIIQSVVQPASEYEQLRIRLVNLYQDQRKANEVFQEFLDLASTTPYAVGDVVAAGAQLKAFGINAEETLKSVADLAAFMGVDIVQAANDVGRAFAGGVGAARTLRDRGVLELIKSFNGIDDLTRLTLPEFRKILIETLQDPAAGIAGLIDLLVVSYEGALSNMMDAMKTLQAEMGTYFLPILENGFRRLTGVIQYFTNSATDGLKRVNNEIETFVQTERQIDTLMLRYDALKAKTNLNASEHEELREVIKKITELVPSAATAFDEYGNAIDINKKRLNEYLSVQKESLRLQLREQIKSVTKEYENRYKTLSSLQESVKANERALARQKQTATAAAATYDRQLSRYKQAWGSDIPEIYRRSLNAFRVRSQEEEENLRKMTLNVNRQARESQQEIAKISHEIDMMVQTLISAGVDFSKGPLSVAYQLGIPLEMNRRLINDLISRWKVLSREVSESPVVGEFSDEARDEIEKWLAARQEARLEERERIEAEHERLLKIAKDAYPKESEEYKKALKDLYEWRAEELQKITDKELADKEAALIRERNSIHAKYREEIEHLHYKHNMGINVYQQMKDIQTEYFRWVKEEYGKDSIEYDRALDEMRQINLRWGADLRRQWMENNAVWGEYLNAMGVGFSTLWTSILDSSMNGSERLKALWHSIRDSFFNAIGQMIVEYGKKKIIELAIAQSTEKGKQAAALQTAAVEQGAQAATQTSLLVTIALKIKDAFASIAGAIAAGFKWLVTTLGPFGLGMGIGLGAALISAFKSLLSGLGFATGGYTGDGGKYEVAGVAHKGEVYFEQEISRPNLAELLGLRSLLQKGYKLRDIIAGGVVIPTVSKPLPSLSLASGGIAGSGQIIDFSGIEGLLSEMNYRLKKIEAKDTNVHLHGETNLIEWHRTNGKAAKEYSRRIK